MKPVAVLSLEALWLAGDKKRRYLVDIIFHICRQHTAVQSWWDLYLVDIVSLSALPAKHYNFDWIGWNKKRWVLDSMFNIDINLILILRRWQPYILPRHHGLCHFLEKNSYTEYSVILWQQCEEKKACFFFTIVCETRNIFSFNDYEII